MSSESTETVSEKSDPVKEQTSEDDLDIPAVLKSMMRFASNTEFMDGDDVMYVLHANFDVENDRFVINIGNVDDNECRYSIDYRFLREPVDERYQFLHPFCLFSDKGHEDGVERIYHFVSEIDDTYPKFFRDNAENIIFLADLVRSFFTFYYMMDETNMVVKSDKTSKASFVKPDVAN